MICVAKISLNKTDLLSLQRTLRHFPWNSSPKFSLSIIHLTFLPKGFSAQKKA